MSDVANSVSANHRVLVRWYAGTCQGGVVPGPPLLEDVSTGCKKGNLLHMVNNAFAVASETNFHPSG